MGVVYSAYDPDLDRRVAIKILHPRSRAATAGSEEGKLRLLREAKALARLSHPNVVTIHDVGTFGSRVFLAMEYVDGSTLGAWLKAAPRSWREVLKVLIAAGEGLQAAHAAGLVHRDFKPENVSLGADGRVRVLDFGLARAAATEGSYPETSMSGAGPEQSASVDLGITSTGVMVGTPAYMSPEQHLGRAADARSDQFAFCVTLYQALYGERPFAGDNVSALQASVIQNKIRPPRPGSKVPKWLRRAVLRGLLVDPEARYRSMDELLGRLRGDPAKRLRRRTALVAVPALLVGLAVGTYGRASESPCAAEREQIEDAWSPEIKGELQRKFKATGLANASTVWESAERLLDDYAAQWVDMRLNSCEATYITKTQPAELHELRSDCLLRRSDELDALLDILGDTNATIVGNALEAIGELTPIGECADVEALRAVLPEPRDPEVRQRIQQARRDIVNSRAHEATGQPRLAREFADRAVEEADSLDYAPLRAEALIAQAPFFDRDGKHARTVETLDAAIKLAADSGHDEALILGWIELLQSVAFYEFGERAAEHLARAADAALRRDTSRRRGADGHSLLRARLDLGLATSLHQAGRYGEARDRALSALEDLEKALTRRHPQTIRARILVGSSELGAHDFAAARRAFQEANEDLLALAGEGPSVAVNLLNLAEVARQTGDHQEALRVATRSVEILTGLGHHDLARALAELASIEEELGRAEEAEAHYAQALTLYEGQPTRESVKLAELLNNLAYFKNARGDAASARQDVERAYALFTSTYGPVHPSTGKCQASLADLMIRLGERERGLAHLDRAIEVLRMHEATRLDLAYALLDGGTALLEQGDAPTALRYLEESIELVRTTPGASPLDRAQARFAGARALLERPEVDEAARARAQELARDALRELKPGGPDEALRAAIEALLAGRE